MKSPNWLSSATKLAVLFALVLADQAHGQAPNAVPTAARMTIEDVIALARQRSEAVRATELMIKSVRSEIAARDLLLSPRLSAEIADEHDNRDSMSTSRQLRTQLIETTLTKNFATGTQATLLAGHEIGEFQNSGERNTGAWEARISQSLWRDGFGRGTSLRSESEAAEMRNRIFTALRQQQSFFVDLEASFWDLVLAQKEEEIRRSNIERSQTVVNWTRDRIRRSLAEPSDLLQAQALLGERELDLTAVQNRLEQQRARLSQLIPGHDPASWTLDLKSAETDRPVTSLLAGEGNATEPVLLDSLATASAARRAAAESRRIDDSLKPQLDAYISYGQNGIENRFSTAWDRASDPERSATRIGVLFSVDLDLNLKNERREAARLDAQARELEARASSRVSSVSWTDLSRQVESLKRQVASAKRLADLQQQKIEAERRRFRQGRTTVFQLITFEVDASEAQMQHYRLLVELRKTESRARLFTRETGETT